MLLAAPLALLLAARLVLNELMIKPFTGGSEWIEIFNAGDEAAPLSGLSIEDSRARPAKLPDGAGELEPGGFLLLVSNVEKVLEAFPAIDAKRVVKPAGTWPTLNDSDGDAGYADQVILRSAKGAVLDSLAYPARWLGMPGQSVERIDAAGPPTLAANWSPCADAAGATPLSRNSLTPKPEEVDQGALVVPRAPIMPGTAAGVATIGWHLATTSELAIELFDLEGRSVRLLRPLADASTVGRVAWDGTDDAGSLCPPGIYMVLLEGRLDGEGAPRRWRKAVVLGGAR